jgi:uncharacterized protein
VHVVDLKYIVLSLNMTIRRSAAFLPVSATNMSKRGMDSRFNMKHALIWAATVAVFANSAAAFTGALPDNKVIDTTPPPRATPMLAELKGFLSWATLAGVRSVKQQDKIVPQFSGSILALDKTRVKVQGFMIPLEAGAGQKRFLLSATSSTCDFCLPGGPETLVEVRANEPIKYTTDPIMVSGNFIVAGNDGDGVLYRLTEAHSTAP